MKSPATGAGSPLGSRRRGLAFWWRPTLDTSREPTPVEVVFTAVEDGTEVGLTHTGWEALGADAPIPRGGRRGLAAGARRFVKATTT